MNTAVSAHGPLVGRVNPFAVRGGGSPSSRKRDDVATSEQLNLILETIRPQWRAIVLIATWCGLRYSEIVALRRSEVDVTNKVIKVRTAVSRSRTEGVTVKDPKSAAGVRDIHIPEHALKGIKTHLRSHVTGRNGLLFPSSTGEYLAPATFYGGRTRKVKGKRVKVYSAGGWYAARTAAGCPELHFHDLRATGATLMAQLGATEAEIQAFLGDSTPQAAQRYVRAAQSRMKKLAARMSDLAASGDW
jgi:integrase